MGNEWRSSLWGDEVSLEYGKSLKGYRDDIGKYRVYGSNGPVGWTTRYLAEGPGVILGRKGAYRGVEYSKESFYVIDTAYYLKPKTELHMRWLYYATKHCKLGEIDDGSPIPSTTRAAVYVREIDIPDSTEQKAIAHILGSLDDKIELNRQMNETLESMAQALFKSWFVDFDPVIDNALAAGNPIPDEFAERAKRRTPSPPAPLPEGEGGTSPLPLGEDLGEGEALVGNTKQQKMGMDSKNTSNNIQTQFPSEFEYTEEMGWIPKGWGVGSFSKFAKLDTSSVKPNNFPEKLWEHFSIPAFDVDKSPVFDLGEEIKSNKYKVHPNSILISKLNPETERIWWVDINDDEAAICSTEFMQFIPLIEKHRAFIYSLVRSENFQIEIKSRVTGSTGSRQRAQPKSVAIIDILKPSENLINVFSEITVDWKTRVSYSIQQNKELTKLRDTLLPKLLSGELLIPDAEKLIAEVI